VNAVVDFPFHSTGYLLTGWETISFQEGFLSTEIIFLKEISRPSFLMEANFVLFELQNEFLYNMLINLDLLTVNRGCQQKL
jgi:hypothetical protein